MNGKVSNAGEAAAARWTVVLSMAALLLVVMIEPANALDRLTGYVNDEAGVISPEAEAILQAELAELDENTSVEMAVATVKSLGGVPIEDYSLALAHGTLGEKEKDNGILILLAVEDREYRIEVGYGLEPVISAARAGRIGRSQMAPHFAQGDYDAGLLQGERAIAAIIRNDTSMETEANPAQAGQRWKIYAIIGAIIIIFVIINIIAANRAVKEKRKKDDDKDFAAAALAAVLFGRGGRGGFGGTGGFGSGGFGGFGGGSFGGGGFSGKY